jgi:4-carboxymuconolactone decarboxylase
MKTPHSERIPELPQGWASGSRAGQPAALAARAEVVSSSEDRHVRGLRALEDITGASGSDVVDSLRDIAPAFADWIVDFSYGDVLTRPGLDRRSRQFATIAALTALGNAAPQLKVHIAGALNVGCKPQEIVEVIMQMAVFAGFPAALNALNIAREVFNEQR